MNSDVVVLPGKSHSSSVRQAFGETGHSDPPRAGAERATGVHFSASGLRDGAGCGERERGLLLIGVGGLVTYSDPRGRGPREPPPHFTLVPPAVPIAESS